MNFNFNLREYVYVLVLWFDMVFENCNRSQSEIKRKQNECYDSYFEFCRRQYLRKIEKKSHLTRGYEGTHRSWVLFGFYFAAFQVAT